MELPSTIKKPWFGYLVISLVGFGLMALIYAGIWSLWRTGDLSEPTYYMLGIVSILVLLITMVELYIYSLSYIGLTEDGLKAENWSSLFFQVDVDTEWVRVQDVTVETGSIFALMFGFGTLTIQTAGTAQNLRMTMVPSVEAWRDVISSFADQAAGSDLVQLSISSADLANQKT